MRADRTCFFVGSLALFLISVTPVKADLEAGQRAYEQGDYAAALTELKPLAEQGNPEAESLLGRMYSAGQGVRLDMNQAVKWFQAAAEQGNPQAQCQLGTMYLTGAAVPKDTAQGLKLLKLSADQGYADAYLTLGLAYMNLKDVPHDLVQADMWLRLAAARHDPIAPGQLARLEHRMTQEQVAKAQALAAVLGTKTNGASR